MKFVIRLVIGILLSILTIGSALTQPSTAAVRNSVSAWNTFASDLVAANLLPGPQTYTLAVTHIAIHDALNAIVPRYEPYEFAGSAPGASADAAVAAAAHG